MSNCDKMVLAEYNVNPTKCSSNFIIKSSTHTYTLNEPVYIKISSITPDKNFVGIYLLAQDSNSITVGSWSTTDLLVENTSCGGLMHKSKAEKNSVEAIWHPSTNLAGDITIRIIIIENDKTIYVNCYNVILSSRKINNVFVTDATTTESNTTLLTTITTENTTESTKSTLSTSVVTTTGASTTQPPAPSDQVTINATWTFDNIHNVTSVIMTITNLQISQWAALGFGTQQAMGEAHVFMCKRLGNGTTVVNRYKNPSKHSRPIPAGSEDGGEFTPTQQIFNDGVVICQFTLSNFTNNVGPSNFPPLSLSDKYYPLFAVGALNASDYPFKHPDDSCQAQSTPVQLSQTTTVLYNINNSDPLKFLRVHGIIMIFTWILLASTGAIIGRYFKTAWASPTICGKPAWFTSHRLVMSIVAILTMLGFLFVLVFLQGTWVDKGPTRQYAHSVTGAIVIAIAFFQPFVALFRCEPSSAYRFIFNYIHRFFGFSSFALATATLFLATYFEIFKNNAGRTYMAIWTVWIVLIHIIFEAIQHHYRKRLSATGYATINEPNSNSSEVVENPKSSTDVLTSFNSPQEPASQKKLKNVFLALHVLIAIIISSLMTSRITW